MRIHALRTIFAACTALAWAVTPAMGQETDEPPADLAPGHAFLVTGYGTTAYDAVFATARTPNDFSAALSPILLFQIADRVLFEAEIEFELEDGETHADLEYADIGYRLTDHLTMQAGKFLLPFNIFSERLHPSWINKTIALPLLYGHGETAGGTMPLLPILSDVGVQLRGSYDIGTSGYLTAVGFVTQGPAMEMPHDEAPPAEAEIPEVAFGENFEDANGDKMVGGRVGFGLAPYLEVNLSGMTARYDEAERLRFTGLGAHVEGRYGAAELHGEWIRTSQQVPDELDPDTRATVVRNGYFAQLAYRIGKVEPVLRWSQILDGDLDAETVVSGGQQLSLGVAYWFEPALVLKVGYLVNRESGADVDNDRIGVQWAFGF